MTLYLSTPMTLGLVMVALLVIVIMVMLAASPPSEGGKHKLGADADATIEPDLDKRA